MAHSLSLRVEGFQLDRLLTECLAKRISLRNIRMISDMEMTVKVSNENYKRLRQVVKRKYKVTVLRERGSVPFFKKIFSKKVSLAGVIIFSFILYYQSIFISEIRIYGYEAVPETRIRAVLRDAGFYEGCGKNIEIENVKQAVYDRIKNIVWVGISAKGGMAEVSVVEGGIKLPAKADNTPCDIVASQAGYVAEIIPREGLRTVEDGTYVNAGDVLITGVIPINSTVYGVKEGGATYVRASGEVKAKVPYYVTFYQERYERKQLKTGRFLYGVEIAFRDSKRNTLDFYSNYEVSKRYRRNLSDTARPFPLKITLIKDEEITLTERERNRGDLKKYAEAQLRVYAKENLPKDARILNKHLKFSVRKNIIEVSIMFDALQEIGKEQEIIFGEF